MYPFLVREDGGLVAEVGLSDVARGAFQSCHLGYSVDAERLRSRDRLLSGRSRSSTSPFTDLGLHRVQAATLVTTSRRRACCGAAHFERIGVAAGYLAIAGAWQDHVLWQRVNPMARDAGSRR